MTDRPEERPDRDDVGTLLRLAGKRAPVSRDRTARVRAAVHAQWRSDLGRRSRRHRAWALAGALAAAASVLVAVTVRGKPGEPLPSAPLDPPALVDLRIGDVQIGAPAQDRVSAPAALEPGDPVPWRSGLTTREAGLLAIRMPSGHLVRVGESTSMRLLDARTVQLDRGKVYVDSTPAGFAAGSISVRTAFGEVTEVGTQFEVRVDDDSLRVRLREGRVTVGDAQRIHEVDAGVELTLGPDGTATRREIASHGAEWDWLLAVTRVPDFEGRPVSALLEWVARERGWSLGFADAETERSTRQTVLRGSFDRLSVDEVLDAAMPASRLAYRVEQGVLIVSTPG